MIGVYGPGSARDHACVLRLAEEYGNSDIRFFGYGNNAVLDTAPFSASVTVEDYRETARQARMHGINQMLITDAHVLQLPVADAFHAAGIPVLGPSSHAAKIEGSKGLMKRLVKEAGVPSPDGWFMQTAKEAKAFLERNWSKQSQFVVKTDHYIMDSNHRSMVPENLPRSLVDVDEEFEALLAVHETTGFVIERRISGFETSVHVLWDGDTYILFPPVRDYKPVFDGDQGPNTNGAAALACGRGFSRDLEEKLRKRIIEPMLQHLSRNGYGYHGFLYFGVMLCEGEPQLIEINVRPGNPEFIVLLSLLRSSFGELIEHAVSGTLHQLKVEWYKDCYSGAVFALADRYPEIEDVSSTPIEGLEAALATGRTVTEGVSKHPSGYFSVSAGRVAAPFVKADSIEAVKNAVYSDLAGIKFAGKHFRSDLGFGIAEGLFANPDPV